MSAWILRSWWANPDSYDWLVRYLHSRGLQRFTRHVVLVTVASLAAVPIVLTLSPQSTTSVGARGVLVVVSPPVFGTCRALGTPPLAVEAAIAAVHGRCDGVPQRRLPG